MIRYAISVVLGILVGVSWASADPPVSRLWSGPAPSGPLAVADANNLDRSPSPQKPPDSALPGRDGDSEFAPVGLWTAWFLSPSCSDCFVHTAGSGRLELARDVIIASVC